MTREILGVLHLIGLSLAVGAGVTKLVLLLRAAADHTLVPAYIRVSKPITGVILAGMVTLLLSGMGYLATGFRLHARLATKLVMVAGVFAIGPVLDKVIEPRYRVAAGAPQGPDTPAFARIQRWYIALELAANALFLAIIVYWKLF